jgi:hypothetical protein
MTSGGHNKTPIRIVESGRRYESQEACAQHLGVFVSGINGCLRGRSKSYMGFHFEYIPEEDFEK